MTPHFPLNPGPRPWQVGLALVLVYLCWSTTYFAIREGVRTLPPLLFGGTRIALAGMVLLAILWCRGQLTRTSGRGTLSLWIAGSLMFLGGNGLINMGQQTVPSGMASVLVATCPLFLALLEWLLPAGERLSPLAWFGLILGLMGVVLLGLGRDVVGFDGRDLRLGATLCLASSFTWALGSIVARHWPSGSSLVQAAALQMFFGGLTMGAVGLAIGEAGELRAESFTPAAIFAFFWLLIVGSLLGFVAYIWLLGNVSPSVAGSYAYVNPGLAILIGWALGGEAITPLIVLGLAVILAGVALVRVAGKFTPINNPHLKQAPSDPQMTAPVEREPITAKT